MTLCKRRIVLYLSSHQKEINMGPVEYFTPVAQQGSRRNDYQRPMGMVKNVRPASPQLFWRAERTLST